jgi:antitoxin (DNA-binding transcriptional repressor) of toxin-antitoxin stability system
MKHVSLADARANIAKLLDEVERGETVTISREGVPARDVAAPAQERSADVVQAIEELKQLRKANGPVTVEEILSWRDEGRRF